MESKVSIRKRILGLRLALSEAEVSSLSREIQARLCSLKIFREARAVSLYADIKNEVKTDAIADWLLREGREVLFPRVTGKDLQFVAVEGKEPLVSGRWGILEPQGGTARDLAEVDAVLVPGIAFDEKGGRLGFGAGYFDRAIKTFKGVKIGLAYDFQILKELPQLEHDLRCDWVVTEKRIIGGAQ